MLATARAAIIANAPEVCNCGASAPSRRAEINVVSGAVRNPQRRFAAVQDFAGRKFENGRHRAAPPSRAIFLDA
jgi:hypothetical protein